MLFQKFYRLQPNTALDGEESDKDAKDLGTMDVDLKDGVMVLMDRGQ